MVTVIKNKWFLLLINLLLSFIFFLLLAAEYNLHHYINALFYIGFSYLILWLISFVIRGRFFDGIVYGFRRFGARIGNKDLLDEWAERPNPSESISTTFLTVILFQGLSLTLIMIGLLVIFYVFMI